MSKEQLESEVKRLRSELFELKTKYNELLRRYTKVHNELTLLKVDGVKNGNKY